MSTNEIVTDGFNTSFYSSNHIIYFYYFFSNFHSFGDPVNNLAFSFFFRSLFIVDDSEFMQVLVSLYNLYQLWYIYSYFPSEFLVLISISFPFPQLSSNPLYYLNISFSIYISWCYITCFPGSSSSSFFAFIFSYFIFFL